MVWRAVRFGLAVGIPLLVVALVSACQSPGSARYVIPCGGCGHASHEAPPPSPPPPPPQQQDAQPSEHQSHRS